MQTLASEAGVSRSTLYRHFPTRDSLEDALREDAIAAVERTVAETVSEGRPPLAVLRALVGALVELASERRLDVLELLPLAERGREAVTALLPLVERLRRAVEIEPGPPGDWLERGAEHFLHACLEAGAAADPAGGAEALFRSLTAPLDQGLVVLEPAGALLALNARAARMLDPEGVVEVGDTLTEPRLEVIYEDGSACPSGTHPLSRAVRTHEVQSGIRGHRDGDGSVMWIATEAYPLRTPDDEVYGVLGVLADVSAEKDWELERLRPPGEFGTATLDIARVLDEIPPHLFPEQFVSEARRISGSPVALYVLDIDGTHLLRLAGPEEFPDRLDAPLALGPELAEDGIPDLKARIEAELPGVVVVPMWLRGRAIGLLLALAAAEAPLLELARHGAAAMELAGGYTDVIAAAQRRKETHAAAELQQSLIPPRIARMGAGTLAGSVLPSYEVGGDWFDFVENRDGAWLAVADAVGKGATAGALAAIALAALRAARRSGQSLEAAAQTMHEVTFDVGRP
ncbi:MAG: PAS domain-containing protein, partial [Actinomycetota bacterium]|nr:PAS domain-containing protein [Actinomycetota bacterium]